MDYYWNPIDDRKKSSSSMSKILAVIVILMIVIGGAVYVLITLWNPASTVSEGIKVAVIDSGVNNDPELLGKIVDERSFITIENGYGLNDYSTGDVEAGGVAHGTLVAKTVVQNNPDIVIVNARVLDSQGSATTKGIIAAIRWSVEMNCSVINLSLGSNPTYADPLGEVVKWASSRGVIVVAAAGNENDGGVRGNSINTPSIFPSAISVGGVDQAGTPMSFSSEGPTADKTMKPDVVSLGYIIDGNAVYQGTSFSSPRVAGMAAELVAYCIANGYLYSPGFY
jgi:major intracellular serine protease